MQWMCHTRSYTVLYAIRKKSVIVFVIVAERPVGIEPRYFVLQVIDVGTYGDVENAQCKRTRLPFAN